MEDAVCPEVVIQTSNAGRRWWTHRMFFTCLFCDEAMALQFLQDVGLLQCKEQGNVCGADMTWSVDNSVSDGYPWQCCRTGGTRCSDSRSIKHGSWFHQRNLPTPRDVPGVVSAIPPHLLHQVQCRIILIIFRLEFGASFIYSLTLLIMSTLQFPAQ